MPEAPPYILLPKIHCTDSSYIFPQQKTLSPSFLLPSQMLFKHLLPMWRAQCATFPPLLKRGVVRIPWLLCQELCNRFLFLPSHQPSSKWAWWRSKGGISPFTFTPLPEEAHQEQRYNRAIFLQVVPTAEQEHGFSFLVFSKSDVGLRARHQLILHQM